jgi:hypothetical protein
MSARRRENEGALLSVANDSGKLTGLLEARVRVPASVVYKNFVKETVILNLETGQYHGVNPTGGQMIAVLEQSPTVREAAARLAAEFGVDAYEIQRDLCEFCDALVERGLLAIESP